MISPAILLTTFSLGTYLSASIMINSKDCTETRCDVVLTSPNQIKVNIISDLSIGFLHSVKNAPKSV